MNPFFFGPSEGPLFGIYYPASADAAGGRGIVICQSLWQEYIRAHWACTQMAQSLSSLGFHVLMFDYFSTGDSAGDSGEGTVERWHDDIAVAVEELRETAGISQVGLLGVRFGASLLCGSCRKNKIDPFAIGYWDPAIRGTDFLSETEAFHHQLGLNVTKSDSGQSSALVGFPVTDSQVQSIRATDETVFFSNQKSPFFIADSAQSAPGEGGWLDKKTYDKIMVPHIIPQNLVSFFGQRIR
jgi:alpha/beta superfamily hydrolase